MMQGSTDQPGKAVSTPAVAAPAVNTDSETGSKSETASARLANLVDAYFEENLELNPVTATFIGDSRYNDRLGNSIGPEHRAAQLAMERRFLAAAMEIDGDALEDQDLLTLEVFILGRREAIEGSEFPAYLLPINQMFSMPSLMAMLGSGRSAQPFATVADYDNFLGRIDDFTIWVDQAIANMREGIEKGVVQPRVIMEKVLPQLAAHVVEDPEESLFWVLSRIWRTISVRRNVTGSPRRIAAQSANSWFRPTAVFTSTSRKTICRMRAQRWPGRSFPMELTGTTTAPGSARPRR